VVRQAISWKMLMAARVCVCARGHKSRGIRREQNLHSRHLLSPLCAGRSRRRRRAASSNGGGGGDGSREKIAARRIVSRVRERRRRSRRRDCQLFAAHLHK